MYIKSYLPIFPGFYDTIFAPCEEDVFNEEEGESYDDFDYHYDEYRDRVVQACSASVESELIRLGFPINIRVEGLQSPKYYNFENDSINVTYRLRGGALGKIKEYVEANMEAFVIYIKERYSSYDGFMSWYSNSGYEWKGYISERGLNENTHYLGAIFQFILENEYYDHNILHENAVQGNIYLHGTRKEQEEEEDV